MPRHGAPVRTRYILVAGRADGEGKDQTYVLDDFHTAVTVSLNLLAQYQGLIIDGFIDRITSDTHQFWAYSTETCIFVEGKDPVGHSFREEVPLANLPSPITEEEA